ncbi:MAG: BamA/TamA family outer membrane protein [Ginsengibacter sp.]
MKIVTALTLALLGMNGIHSAVHAQDSVEQRILIIGDAGEFTKDGKQPVLAAARKMIPLDEKTTVIFVGDNLYNYGLPDELKPNYNKVKAPLDSQIALVNGTKAKAYFLPGNHDWADGGKSGWEAIVREQTYVDQFQSTGVNFYPKDGCPGPVQIPIGENILLIIMDSQWWVHIYDKPGIESDCPYKTKAEVLTQLGDILDQNPKKLILFACHHPFKSNGIHGGFFTLKQHIFPFTDVIPKAYIPLPVIGSIYPITRSVFGTSEDLAHPLYADMISAIEGVIRGHQNVIYLAGHEHTLQLLKDSSYYFLVSGSGSKSTRVSRSRKSLFVSSLNGFATLEVSKNKSVTASFYTLDSNKVSKPFTQNILNFSKIEKPKDDSTHVIEYAFKDSVVLAASDRYKNPTGLRKTILGKNYREEWSVPVAWKMFNVKKEKGGLTFISLGGGKQTRSAICEDPTGKQWTLRSIDKDPEKTLPQGLQGGTLAKDIIQDLISASHPYGALMVSPLATAAGIVAPDPEYFYVPDDPALGFYRPFFKNTVCLLEARDPTPDETDTRTTAKIINKLVDNNNTRIEQASVLRARLLDNLIGDWDRHFDQWKWGSLDTGKGKLYYPVPRDRDQAFFNSDGFLMKYISKNQLKFLQGFKKNITDIKWLNWEERDFDRFFMNRLDKQAWVATIDSFQHNITDAVIADAVKKLPPAVYAMDKESITEKLKSRRDQLMKDGLNYYKALSKVVTIIGSNDPEYFRVTKADNGMAVFVYKKNKAGDTSAVMYNRVFDQKETEEIRLYGLNGDDEFEVDPDVDSKIRLRIIGGKGNDTFNIKGKVPNLLYDITYEKNVFLATRNSRKRFSSDPTANEYKVTGFNYDSHRFPEINIAYNPEDKLLVGIGFSSKKYGFMKSPFAVSQKLTTLYAISHKAYQVKYQGIFNDAIFHRDILVNAEIVNPTLNNFFGLGNQTEKLPGKQLEYYRTRYKYLHGDLLLRRKYGDLLSVSYGPTYYHYWNEFEDNKGRILADPQALGLDSSSIYSVKDYAGAKFKIDLSYLNNQLFPSRGIEWNTEFSSLFGLNSNSKNLTKLTSDMTVYASLNNERKFFAIIRLGGGHIFSKNYEYFQALNLGSNNFNRGFRKNRFSGSSLAYGSMELRVKLYKSQSYILPGDVGVIGFYDIGRVWKKEEISHRWHQSFGGGLYYAPFNLIVISGTVGISSEDQLFNFSLGTKFNLTF